MSTALAGSAGAVADAAANTSGRWRVVDGPQPGAWSYLADVTALSPTDAWAVGEYGKPPPALRSLTLIEHWDGSTWTTAPSPSPPSRYGAGFSAVLALAPNDVWAAGSSAGKVGDRTLIEHWDGSAWSVVPSPSPGASDDLYDLMSSGSNGSLWAVGSTQPTYGGENAPLVEEWNGSRWKVVPAQDPPGGASLYGGAAVSANDAWVVGEASGAGDQSLAEHWDGTSWSIVPTPGGDPDSSLDEVAAVTTSDVWAVGEGSLGAIIERWDGNQWSLVPAPRSSGVTLNGVAARSATSAWAVGERSRFGNRVTTRTERWNGAGWSVVGSPNGTFAESNLLAVAVVPGSKQTWAVGISTPVDGSTAASLIELYS
jgi:hypothetical protein